jgi:hypothetical protein
MLRLKPKSRKSARHARHRFVEFSPAEAKILVPNHQRFAIGKPRRSPRQRLGERPLQQRS